MFSLTFCFLVPKFAFTENLTQKNQEELARALKRAAFHLMFKRERGKTVVAPLSLHEFTFAQRLLFFQNELLDSLTDQAEAVADLIRKAPFSEKLKQAFFFQLREAYLFQSMDDFVTFSAINAFIEEKQKALRSLKEAVQLSQIAKKWGIEDQTLLKLSHLRAQGELLPALAEAFEPVCRKSAPQKLQKGPFTYSIRFSKELVVVYGEPQKLAKLKQTIEMAPERYSSMSRLLSWLSSQGFYFERFQAEKQAQPKAFLGTLRQGFLKGVLPPLVGLPKEPFLEKLKCLGYRVVMEEEGEILKRAGKPISLCTLYASGTKPFSLVYASPCP